MPTTLAVVNRTPITYESAIDKDDNFIRQAAYVGAQESLYQEIWRQREHIAALVLHHLNLPRHAYSVTVAEREQWIRGAFNVCIPVDVGPPVGPLSKAGGASGVLRPQHKLMFRCPLPYKLAEAKYPGTVDEKMGCEVGAYAWMQDQCPDVRIPHLYGFGFSEQRQVYLSRPLLSRCLCNHCSYTCCHPISANHG
jgi:hypothetical protein